MNYRLWAGRKQRGMSVIGRFFCRPRPSRKGTPVGIRTKDYGAHGLADRPPRRYQVAMTKTARELRAEATEYRELAETFKGASMQQALLETAMALERLCGRPRGQARPLPLI